MTCLYFSWKIEKVPQTGPLYTTLEYLHYLQILNKTLLACFYHGGIPISSVFSFFIFLLFRHFTISVSLVFISFIFFLQTLFSIYFLYILFFCLFLFQTNHHIFLLLAYPVYLYCFCSTILLYLALILCSFGSRLNRHYSSLFIYLKKYIYFF